MKSYYIHLIRHGKTKGNVDGKYVGRTDIPLVEDGRQELKELCEKYKYPYVDKVFVSPLLRCRETADIIYPNHPDLTVVDDIIEYSFGDFEGKTFEDLKDDEAFQKWLKNSLENAPTNGENMDEFTMRCTRGFDNIVNIMMKSGQTDCAIVTHGGVIMNIMSNFALPKKGYYEWLVGNGRGYTLRITPSLYMSHKIAELVEVLPSGIGDTGNEAQLKLYKMK